MDGDSGVHASSNQKNNERGVTSGVVVYPVQRRMVVWDAQGMPAPISVPMVTKEQIDDVLLAALAMPYSDPLGLEPQYEGMTNVEVMLIKKVSRAAAGDAVETELVLDRAIGKPRTFNDSKTLSINGSYEDYLKGMVKDAIPVAPSPAATPPEGDLFG